MNSDDRDDDLWLSLYTCVDAMERARGNPCWFINKQKLGLEDAKYLRCVNEFAADVGWDPFISDTGDAVEVVTPNGRVATCRRDHSGDDIGGTAVLNALRLLLQKRTSEIEGSKAIEGSEEKAEIPDLEMDGVVWIPRQVVVDSYKYSVNYLNTARTESQGGKHFKQREGGIDKGGRVWMPNPDDPKDIWYLATTVKKNPRKT